MKTKSTIVLAKGRGGIVKEFDGFDTSVEMIDNDQLVDMTDEEVCLFDMIVAQRAADRDFFNVFG